MKRSGLSEQTLSALKEALPDLLYKWSPAPRASDWVCAFCNRRPASFDQSEIIEHAPDCLGIQIQNDLEVAE